MHRLVAIDSPGTSASSFRRALVPGVLGLLVGGLIGLAIVLLGPDNDAHPQVPSQLDVLVTGADFHWDVRYPGPDGEVGTADDRVGTRDVHVPAGTDVQVHLRSRDYVYTFAIPELSLKEIAVPDMEFALRFRSPGPGQTLLLGDQMCGYDHPDLIGKLVVTDPAAFARTMEALPAWKDLR